MARKQIVTQQNVGSKKMVCFEVEGEKRKKKRVESLRKILVVGYLASHTHIACAQNLLEGNETRRVGGTDTGATVLDGPVGDGELGQVVADHLGLDLDLVELLARVDTNDAANHLRDDNHVTEVSLDDVGLLVGLGLLLGLAELLDETHGLALQATVDPATGTGVDDIAELIGAKVEQLLEVDTAVGKLAEGSLALELNGLLGVLWGERC